MKKSISFLIAYCLSMHAFTQNTGIGTALPQARLHVADSSVVFTAAGSGSGAQGEPPISETGRRMMWYATKTAFRAGYGLSGYWDKNNTGTYSMAFGLSSRAVGAYSNAMGYLTSATDHYSTAMGYQTDATGYYSTAIGYHSESTGVASTAMGSGTLSTGENAIAMGRNTSALGYSSTAFGNTNEVSGASSIAMGTFTSAPGNYSTSMNFNTSAIGNFSTAMGDYTRAYGYASTVIGIYNRTPSYSQTSIEPLSPIFIIGNGNSTARSNAMLIRHNGNTGIGTSEPSALLSLDAVGTSNPVMNVNDENPSIQLQSSGVDKGFVQLNGNNIRIGVNATNTTGHFAVRTNNNDQFYIFPSGYALLAGTLVQNSDARYKQNIEPLSNSLDKLMQLQGYQYFWKPELKKDERLQIGLIAQNVEAVYPELVITDANGIKSVAYQNLVPVLIEAIKEQHIMVERHQAFLDDQSKMNMHFKQRLQAIEKLLLKQVEENN